MTILSYFSTDELLIKIFSHLPPPKILSVREVCKRFKGIIDTSWRPFFEEKFAAYRDFANGANWKESSLRLHRQLQWMQNDHPAYQTLCVSETKIESELSRIEQIGSKYLVMSLVASLEEMDQTDFHVYAFQGEKWSCIKTVEDIQDFKVCNTSVAIGKNNEVQLWKTNEGSLVFYNSFQTQLSTINRIYFPNLDTLILICEGDLPGQYFVETWQLTVPPKQTQNCYLDFANKFLTRLKDSGSPFNCLNNPPRLFACDDSDLHIIDLDGKITKHSLNDIIISPHYLFTTMNTAFIVSDFKKVVRLTIIDDNSVTILKMAQLPEFIENSHAFVDMNQTHLNQKICGLMLPKGDVPLPNLFVTWNAINGDLIEILPLGQAMNASLKIIGPLAIVNSMTEVSSTAIMFDFCSHQKKEKVLFSNVGAMGINDSTAVALESDEKSLRVAKFA